MTLIGPCQDGEHRKQWVCLLCSFWNDFPARDRWARSEWEYCLLGRIETFSLNKLGAKKKIKRKNLESVCFSRLQDAPELLCLFGCNLLVSLLSERVSLSCQSVSTLTFPSAMLAPLQPPSPLSQPATTPPARPAGTSSPSAQAER